MEQRLLKEASALGNAQHAKGRSKGCPAAALPEGRLHELRGAVGGQLRAVLAGRGASAARVGGLVAQARGW